MKKTVDRLPPVNKTDVDNKIPEDVLLIDSFFREVYPHVYKCISSYRNCKYIPDDDLMKIEAQIAIRRANFEDIRPLLLRFMGIIGEPTETDEITVMKKTIETDTKYSIAKSSKRYALS